MRAENEKMRQTMDCLVGMTELIMNRVNENRNDTVRPNSPLLGPSEMPATVLPNALKSVVPKTPKSLLIQGNKEFGDSEKIRAYFKELVDVHPEVKDKSDDIKLQTVDFLIKNVRPVALHSAKKLLKDMKATSVAEEGLYWQKAAFLGINLTECQDHWVALALLRKIYQNNCNPKEDEEKKKKIKGKGKEREDHVSHKTVVIDEEVLNFLDECESLSGKEE
ncbi:hypothetical protein G6F56_012176 [Rhizopus delemar]|nr:hypothetical protein G6F56_012176 [Rhizopus delemar]